MRICVCVWGGGGGGGGGGVEANNIAGKSVVFQRMNFVSCHEIINL